MREDLNKLSQSIVEIAKEVDGHVNNYGKSTPNDDTAAVVAARLALDRLLNQAKELDRLLYEAGTVEHR